MNIINALNTIENYTKYILDSYLMYYVPRYDIRGKNNDREVDFVVKGSDGLKYIQVCLSVREESTLKRELASLETINDNYPKYIITLDYDTANHNGIKQISALDFLLVRTEI